MEREALLGAVQTIVTFKPKLALCTYHLPDDPVILERTLRQIAPDYRIVHTSHKMFAFAE